MDTPLVSFCRDCVLTEELKGLVELYWFRECRAMRSNFLYEDGLSLKYREGLYVGSL